MLAFLQPQRHRIPYLGEKLPEVRYEAKDHRRRERRVVWKAESSQSLYDILIALGKEKQHQRPGYPPEPRHYPQHAMQSLLRDEREGAECYKRHPSTVLERSEEQDDYE